jgi:hypothetical protein
MITITADTSAVTKAIEGAIAGLEDLKPEIPVELTNWQIEDMRRQFPNTETPDENTAETDIWPRSRSSAAHRPSTGIAIGRPRGTGGRRIAAPRIVNKGEVIHSARPILRPELFQKLCERMRALLASAVPWR